MPNDFRDVGKCRDDVMLGLILCAEPSSVYLPLTGPSFAVRSSFLTKEGLMAFYHTCCQISGRFRLLLSSFMLSDGLAFADTLPEEKIQRAFDEEEAGFAEDDDAIYTPPLALWAFLSQVLFKEEQRSCAAAVARVVVLSVALNQKPSLGTGKCNPPDSGRICVENGRDLEI